MAYVEFRPLVNTEGEREYDLCAYTDEEAQETFEDELEERASRKMGDEDPLLRRVGWTDDEVQQFNERMREHYTLLMDVMFECGLA